MNTGVAFGRAYQLTPDVALSAEQMVLLTTDVVWLTTQNLTIIANGKAEGEGNIRATGAQINAGRQATLACDRRRRQKPSASRWRQFEFQPGLQQQPEQ